MQKDHIKIFDMVYKRYRCVISLTTCKIILHGCSARGDFNVASAYKKISLGMKISLRGNFLIMHHAMFSYCVKLISTWVI